MQSERDKDITRAKNVIAQFYTAICKRQQPSRKLVQQSYLRDVAQQGSSGLYTSKIEALRRLGIRSYKITHTKPKGENMIQFGVELNSKIGTLLCNPNAIKEDGAWGINPVSTLPQKESIIIG